MNQNTSLMFILRVILQQTFPQNCTIKTKSKGYKSLLQKKCEYLFVISSDAVFMVDLKKSAQSAAISAYYFVYSNQVFYFKPL